MRSRDEIQFLVWEMERTYHEKDNQRGAGYALRIRALAQLLQGPGFSPQQQRAKAVLEKGITISSVWNPWSSNPKFRDLELTSEG